MSTAYLVFTFLGGAAVGAIGAAGVTAWHNSRERLRDRMVTAAEAFLVAVADARSALWTVEVASHELLEAKVQAVVQSGEAAKKALELRDAAGAAAGSESPSATDSVRAAHRALRVVQRLVEASGGQENPLDTSRREEATTALEAARETVHTLDEHADTPVAELAPILRETVRHQARFVTALQGRGDAGHAVYRAMQAVQAAVARVMLSFPATDAGANEVGARAEDLKELLISADLALIAAMRAEVDPYTDAEVARLFQASNTAQGEFARVANAEICKRRWPWDL